MISEQANTALYLRTSPILPISLCLLHKLSRTAVDFPSPDKVVNNTQDTDKTENSTGPVHVLCSRAIEQREETNDGAGQHVKKRDDVERNAKATERPAGRRKRCSKAAAPENTANAEGVGQSKSSGEEADDRVEDPVAAEVEKGDDDADAEGGQNRVYREWSAVYYSDVREPVGEGEAACSQVSKFATLTGIVVGILTRHERKPIPVERQRPLR